MSTTTAAPGSTTPSCQVQYSGTCPVPREIDTATATSSVLVGGRGEVSGLDALHHRGIGERGGVTERLVLGDVAQQPTHDLARARLREVFGEEHRLRLGDGADGLAHVVAQVGDERVAGVVAGAQDHEGADRLARGR